MKNIPQCIVRVLNLCHEKKQELNHVLSEKMIPYQECIFDYIICLFLFLDLLEAICLSAIILLYEVKVLTTHTHSHTQTHTHTQ